MVRSHAYTLASSHTSVHEHQYPMTISENAHAGSRARVISMGRLYDAATLHAHGAQLFFQRRLIACTDSTEDSTLDVSSTAWSDPMHTRCPAARLQCMSIIIPCAQSKMRMPRVKPGSQAWEACMMPLHFQCAWITFFEYVH